jgi:hypothetical protein
MVQVFRTIDVYIGVSGAVSLRQTSSESTADSGRVQKRIAKLAERRIRCPKKKLGPGWHASSGAPGQLKV